MLSIITKISTNATCIHFRFTSVTRVNYSIFTLTNRANYLRNRISIYSPEWNINFKVQPSSQISAVSVKSIWLWKQFSSKTPAFEASPTANETPLPRQFSAPAVFTVPRYKSHIRRAKSAAAAREKHLEQSGRLRSRLHKARRGASALGRLSAPPPYLFKPRLCSPINGWSITS